MLITFTADRSMPEFKRLLLTGQCHHDRPDCTCRLFMDKVDEFILDVEVRQIFGPIKTWSFSLEFQKGFVKLFLPTMHFYFHILLTFFQWSATYSLSVNSGLGRTEKAMER